MYIFDVQDNGSGISTDYIDKVFNPGFSTRINYETGAVSRGLGLSIVRDIVENILSGTVSVKSESNGTLFTISVPMNRLEVMQ